MAGNEKHLGITVDAPVFVPLHMKGADAEGGLRFRGRIPVCPECNGPLGSDKDRIESESGFIYRKRLCEICGAKVYTKQTREEITGIETFSACAD